MKVRREIAGQRPREAILRFMQGAVIFRVFSRGAERFRMPARRQRSRVSYFGHLSRGLPVLPARRGNATRRNPGVEIGLVDSDRTSAEPDDGRTFANRKQPFEVTNRAANPVGGLLLAENFAQLTAPYEDCRGQSSLREI